MFFFYAFFLFIEADFSTTGTYIAIVGIGHFTRAVDDTAHDTDFQSLEVSRSRLDAGDGRFQVVQCTSATRTRDVFGFGSTDTSCLQDTEGGFVHFQVADLVAVVIEQDTVAQTVDNQGTMSAADLICKSSVSVS